MKEVTKILLESEEKKVCGEIVYPRNIRKVHEVSPTGLPKQEVNIDDINSHTNLL